MQIWNMYKEETRDKLKESVSEYVVDYLYRRGYDRLQLSMMVEENDDVKVNLDNFVESIVNKLHDDR